MKSFSKIYLDYAATTPMDPSVKKAMMLYFSEKFGNPSSLHSFGQEALAAVDKAREKIADMLNANFREIIFTGSATEANNLALRGVIEEPGFQVLGFNENNNNLKPKTKHLSPRIIVSAIEHESILETCRDLEHNGIEIIYLPVNKQGIVNLKKLKESLNERTVLVSVMYANNEIGTIQPITKISKIIEEFKKNKFLNLKPNTKNLTPIFHTDAVQAFQFLDCNVNNLGIDLMTLSAHKIYGPKGIGVLYINSKLQNPNYKQIQNSNLQIIKPIIMGGGQEFGLRSGTENVSAIVGFAKAIELAVQNREKETKRIMELSNYFLKEIKRNSKIQIHSNLQINSDTQLPNILNFNFSSQNAQDLLMKLDLNGIAASSGSACSARATKLSHVLKAIGLPDKKIKNSVRFSFGKFTTKEEINKALKIIKKVL